MASLFLSVYQVWLPREGLVRWVRSKPIYREIKQRMMRRDRLVEDIARSSVDETMQAMESEMQCKVRKGGLEEDRRTGEMLYSKFFHRDCRPIDGLSDPHWHVHCFVNNATFDPIEKRWKAGQFRGLIADKGYFQEYFHTLLARRLMEFRPGEKWTVRQTNCETFTLERNGQARQFKPSAEGKWDVLVSSTMEVSVEIRSELRRGSGKGKTCSRTTMLPGCERSPIRSSCYMTGGECAGMVRASIKASALPLMQASAVRSTRFSCCRTALMRKRGMSAYRELEARCTSTPATRQSCVNR
jgi:TrwC relaxase